MVILHTLGLLCALGAVTLAAAANPRWQTMAWIAGGFVLSVFWIPVSPVWIGGISAVVAALRLSNLVQGADWMAAAVAGMLAGVWASVLHLNGVSWPVALTLAAAAPLTALTMKTRRAAFAPRPVTDEALAGVCALGLVVAVGPDVAAGWRSARALNVEGAVAVQGGLDTWIVVTISAAVLSGAVHSLWRRQ